MKLCKADITQLEEARLQRKAAVGPKLEGKTHLLKSTARQHGLSYSALRLRVMRDLSENPTSTFEEALNRASRIPKANKGPKG